MARAAPHGGARKRWQVIRQRAFFYYHDNNPGLGIIAEHEHDGWQRVHFYAFGVDMDAFHKEIADTCEEALLQEKVLSSRLAQSKVIIAGGVVFKNMGCVVGEGVKAGDVVEVLEKRVDGLRTVNPADLQKVDAITPLNVYCFTYAKKVIGISRVVFFEYATQMSFVGIYRDQDRNLVNELFNGLSGLHEYMTTPKPLRTDEKDERVEVNMFMIRHPLKEELQADFVHAIAKVPELYFYTA